MQRNDTCRQPSLQHDGSMVATGGDSPKRASLRFHFPKIIIINPHFLLFEEVDKIRYNIDVNNWMPQTGEVLPDRTAPEQTKGY